MAAADSAPKRTSDTCVRWPWNASVHGHRGQHLVAAARQQLQHAAASVACPACRGCAVDGDRGVGRQHGPRHIAQLDHAVGEMGFFMRHARHVVERGFAAALLRHVHAAPAIAAQQQLEIDADLAQQFAPARALEAR
jgi:hypothetical protein